jgi:hypothetical protein
MRSRSFFLLPLACLAAIGCSSTATSTSDSGAAANPNDLKATFAPIDVPAGVETTQCIVVPLGNTQDVLVQSVEVNLAPGSHHMIVYSTTDQARDEPLNCAPFTGIALGTDVPLFFANKDQASFSFPTGIAQEIPANTMVKIEAHYINASTADIQGQGTVTFHTTPKAGAPAYQAANFLFWGNTDISIPPNASFSTGPQFQVAPANTHLFLVTTHQHRLGTRAQVWASAQAGDMSTPLADDKDWSNPSWRMLAPQVDFNGTNGLTFQCDWMNTTTQTVSFGESALDEMCFIGGYYYPSQGLSLCVNGQCHHKGH